MAESEAAAAAAEADIVIYHERQRLQLCLLHALARRLASSSHPLFFFFFFTLHHNSLTGNYDVNVLTAALQDHSKTPASSIDLAAPHLLGLLLTTAVPRALGGPAQHPRA